MQSSENDSPRIVDLSIRLGGETLPQVYSSVVPSKSLETKHLPRRAVSSRSRKSPLAPSVPRRFAIYSPRSPEGNTAIYQPSSSLASSRVSVRSDTPIFLADNLCVCRGVIHPSESETSPHETSSPSMSFPINQKYPPVVRTQIHETPRPPEDLQRSVTDIPRALRVSPLVDRDSLDSASGLQTARASHTPRLTHKVRTVQTARSSTATRPQQFSESHSSHEVSRRKDPQLIPLVEPGPSSASLDKESIRIETSSPVFDAPQEVIEKRLAERDTQPSRSEEQRRRSADGEMPPQSETRRSDSPVMVPIIQIPTSEPSVDDDGHSDLESETRMEAPNDAEGAERQAKRQDVEDDILLPISSSPVAENSPAIQLKVVQRQRSARSAKPDPAANCPGVSPCGIEAQPLPSSFLRSFVSELAQDVSPPIFSPRRHTSANDSTASTVIPATKNVKTASHDRFAFHKKRSHVPLYLLSLFNCILTLILLYLVSKHDRATKEAHIRIHDLSEMVQDLQSEIFSLEGTTPAHISPRCVMPDLFHDGESLTEDKNAPRTPSFLKRILLEATWLRRIRPRKKRRSFSDWWYSADQAPKELPEPEFAPPPPPPVVLSAESGMITIYPERRLLLRSLIFIWGVSWSVVCALLRFVAASLIGPVMVGGMGWVAIWRAKRVIPGWLHWVLLRGGDSETA